MKDSEEWMNGCLKRFSAKEILNGFFSLLDHSMVVLVGPQGQIVKYNEQFRNFIQISNLKGGRQILINDIFVELGDRNFFESIMKIIDKKGQWSGRLQISDVADGDCCAIVHISRVNDDDTQEALYSVHFFKEFHDEEYRKWKMLAFTDELTGLLNWRKFKEKLKVEIKESDELQKPFGLFFIDIDNFKEINDQYGHIVGDRVLKQCAERLAGALGQKMYAFRKSGDEFLVLIKDIKQIEQTYQEIKKTFSRGFLIRQSIKQLTVSIGVSIYPECGHNEESIIHQANISMYREKIRRSK